MRSVLLTLLLVLRYTAVTAEDIVYEKHIRPVLKAHCFHCHGEEEKPEGGLDLRLVRTMLKGGESGPALIAGKAEESLLWQRIAAGEMPPEGKRLPEADQALLRRWIESGAKTARPEPEAPAAGVEWTEEERGYWAFQPVRRPPVPEVRQAGRVQTPVDAFLLAELEARGLTFSDRADRRVLVRRLSFDLLGLPPAPELVERFVADESPDAFDRIVTELLEYPAYGERWARHWLDAAGYADSDGYTEDDRIRPWAWRYRDYVIRSFNDDKPLDQFIVEQLAGDELLAPPYENLSVEDADRLAATGFLRTAPDGTGEGGVDQNLARNDVMAETIKIVSTSLLGLTVGCAQCHHHRYDPISQDDYFRFRAIFEPALDWKQWRSKPERLVNLWTTAEREEAAKVDAELREIEGRRVAELDGIVNEVFEREVGKLPAEQQAAAREARDTPADKRTPEHLQLLKDHPSLKVDRGSVYLYERKRLQEFNKRYEELNAATRAKRPPESFVACLTEVPGRRPPTHLFYRGDHNQPRAVVPPGDLSVLASPAQIPDHDPQRSTSGRRLAWAKSLTSGQHPLLARVLVNRIWMHHFGRGLVASPGDFGVLGEKPTHPALLDWLADELVQSGWRQKSLHRLIVTSAAWQQKTDRRAELQELDPDNALLGRMNVRRLETEAIRDAMLEVSGVRTLSLSGPPSDVNPDEVGQIIVGVATRDGNGLLVAKAEDKPAVFRRSVYVQARRSMPLGMLEPFDPAAMTPNCDRRSSSTVAPQALLMMNNEQILSLADRLAGRVLTEAGEDAAAQVRQLWSLAYSQPPDDEEIRGAVDFLALQKSYFEQTSAAVTSTQGPPAVAPARQALALLCQAVLSSNRFLYVE